MIMRPYAFHPKPATGRTGAAASSFIGMILIDDVFIVVIIVIVVKVVIVVITPSQPVPDQLTHDYDHRQQHQTADEPHVQVGQKGQIGRLAPVLRGG